YLSEEKRPRYGQRKLKIGLVSCMLGSVVFLAMPVFSHAEKISPENESVIEEKLKEEDLKKKNLNEANVATEENSKEEPTTTEEKPLNDNLNETNESLEEKQEDLTSEKEETLDNKAENREASPANENLAEATDENTADKVELSVNENQELEISDETKKESLREVDPNIEHKDISNELISPKIKITTDELAKQGTLNAAAGENIRFNFSFVTPKGTKPGDTVTINLPDNLNIAGIRANSDVISIKSNDKVIATGHLDGNKLIYTFTDDIKDMQNVYGYADYAAYDTPEVIRNSSNQDFTISIGNKSDTVKLYVDYGEPFDQNGMDMKSQFTKFNPETGEFTQIFYVNKNSRYISPVGYDTGLPVENAVGMAINNGSDPNSDVYYTEDNTTVKVIKLDKGSELPDAIMDPPEDVGENINPSVNFDNGTLIFNLSENKGIDSPYIVVINSKVNSNDENIEALSSGFIFGNKNADLGTSNVIYNALPKEEGNADLGSFQEHHIYITRINGVEQPELTITIDQNTETGTVNDNYVTSSKDLVEGYTFDHTENPVNNPTYNEDGEEASGPYVKDTKQEITYVYYKDIEEKGTFVEHHIYYDVYDKDNPENNKIGSQKDVDPTTGTETEEYTTSKKDKEGYKFVEVKGTAVTDPTGKEAKGNYIANKTLEATYIYVKEEPGDPNPGTPEPGNPNPGTPEPGNPNPGTPEPGEPNPGTPEPGEPNPGTPEPGDSNPGTPEPGNSNSDRPNHDKDNNGSSDKENKVNPKENLTKAKDKARAKVFKSNNPKTGISGIGSVIGLLVSSTTALFSSKRKKK
ncbi:MAG: Ig-like domain-containing protein, partial [Anaerococcus sp.]|nr:Ig-like domain-containing protein [Anaerococcus sp.]